MKKIKLSLCLLAVIFLFNNFFIENPYFKISKNDVKLEFSKEFPKPYYTFKDNKITPEIFLLGRKLFYDNILSKDNTVSCGTCHQRIAAFAHIDHPLSHGIYAKIGTRNVPALQNLIWKDSYMWDGGVTSLEMQPVNPITSPIEMDETMDNVLKKLNSSMVYKHLFKKAYNDTVINSVKVLKSLAQFTGLMISSNSRYDKYLRKQDTFSVSEKKGLILFKAKCESCHSGPLLSDNSYRNNGIKTDTVLKDLGRKKISGRPEDFYKFKVPSLRNVEMTYPYMHDGRFRNLQEVLNHYSNQQYFNTNADTLVYKVGNLTLAEKSDIISFLKTLTDKTFLYDRRFVDPNLEYAR
jgi:cytochrome c peroxidase